VCDRRIATSYVCTASRLVKCTRGIKTRNNYNNIPSFFPSTPKQHYPQFASPGSLFKTLAAATGNRRPPTETNRCRTNNPRVGGRGTYIGVDGKERQRRDEKKQTVNEELCQQCHGGSVTTGSPA